MATGKPNKKLAAVAVDLPECPVCMETMTAPIFQCNSGHSLCKTCTQALMPPMCPICRQPMTQMRNWQLEDIIMKARVPCHNKASGCVYVVPAVDMDKHLKECIFRDMLCPLACFGKCVWKGKLTAMMDHFKERHPENCDISSDKEVELDNLKVSEDDRRVFLITIGKFHFIFTLKIDTAAKMSYWAIQHIGSKEVAHQHIYELHLTSKKDEWRKVTFIEHCFNDSVKAEEVFNQAKCGLLPIPSLSNFIKDRKLSFRFFIKRLPTGPNENKPANSQNKGFKGPGPKGPGFKKPSKGQV